LPLFECRSVHLYGIFHCIFGLGKGDKNTKPRCFVGILPCMSFLTAEVCAFMQSGSSSRSERMNERTNERTKTRQMYYLPRIQCKQSLFWKQGKYIGECLAHAHFE
jgi:hypothetical protein